MTADPAHRVASILEPLLPYADEVVIAADARVDEHTLSGYAALADRLFRVEYRAIERHMAWLFAQCSGDWILRLDGDEIPSSAFVKQLPDLLGRRDVEQFWTAVQWLYPNTSSMLVGSPWSENFVARVLRNDGTLRFRGLQHMHADPVRPREYLTAPFYHVDLLTNSEQQRREKAIRYEAILPGMQASGGGRFNESFYLPELRDTLEYRAVPADDRAAIDRAMAKAPATGRRDGGEPVSAPFVSLREMDRLWEQRQVPQGAYRARIEPYDEARIAIAPGAVRSIFLYVTNEGNERWPARLQEMPEIRLGYRWLDRNGAVHSEDEPRSPFPRVVEPGERVLAPLDIVAPSAAGEYLLEADIVHEHVRWFGCACRMSIRVEPARGGLRFERRLRETFPEQTQRPGNLRIPPTIHRIWLEKNAIDEQRTHFGESFVAHHPGWEMRLWTEADLHELEITAAERDACGSSAELANLMLYEILNRSGGVYVDTDMECRRTLTPLLGGIDAFAALERPGVIGSAILGAVPAHPLFAHAARLARRTLGEGEHPERANGAYFLSLLAELHPDVAIFGSQLFYPDPQAGDGSPDAYTVPRRA
jgi:hypothetical protein